MKGENFMWRKLIYFLVGMVFLFEMSTINIGANDDEMESTFLYIGSTQFIRNQSLAQ